MSRIPSQIDRSNHDATLSLRDLRFRYPGGESTAWVVDVPRLDLAAGEQMLLRGGSGTGKSTLLNLVAGLMTPSSGAVLVKGTDIHALRGAARDRFRGRTIGMIFQTFNLLQGFTAAENVMAALMFSDRPRGQHRDLAHGLLAHLGITTPDREVSRLSVGQQQRVAVARAVACDPALVLADEPTASLDPENAGTAIELIQSICREKNAALLCVSHDPSIVSRFERAERLEGLRSEAVV